MMSCSLAEKKRMKSGPELRLETTKTVIVKVADVSASYCHLGYSILKLQRQL